MPFDSISGREAGKRSKKTSYSEKLKPLLFQFLIEELSPETLKKRMSEASPNQRLKFIAETINYILPKASELRLQSIKNLSDEEAIELLKTIKNG
jgi:hypothetical protein